MRPYWPPGERDAPAAVLRDDGNLFPEALHRSLGERQRRASSKGITAKSNAPTSTIATPIQRTVGCPANAKPPPISMKQIATKAAPIRRIAVIAKKRFLASASSPWVMRPPYSRQGDRKRVVEGKSV